MADMSKSEALATTTTTSTTPSASSLRSYPSSLDDSHSDSSHDPHYFPDRPPPRSFLARAWRRLLWSSSSSSSSSRRSSLDYMAAPSRDDLPGGLLRSKPHSSPRRRTRRSTLAHLSKRLLVIIPILLLMLFGVLHLLQVLIGRARLFWDVEAEDSWLPHWGWPGHPGHDRVDYPGDATRDILPIPCHSHNDYWRRVPLFDALHAGCTSVEADVWLFDDDLYVGHRVAALTRNRTFTAMYVRPLVELLDDMNRRGDVSNDTRRHGVFDVDPAQTLVLLVDFKTNGHDLFPVVSRQLQALRANDYLTYWDGSRVHSRAVTVVGTGNTPFDLVVANHTRRDIFFDAPLGRLWAAPAPPASVHDARDHAATLSSSASSSSSSSSLLSSSSSLSSSISTSSSSSSGQGQVGTDAIGSLDAFNPATSYYASTSLRAAVGLLWRGTLSTRQLDIIRGQIRGARARGLRVRYWDTPAWPIGVRDHVWRALMREGADVLNVDDLRSAAKRDWTRPRRHEWW